MNRKQLVAMLGVAVVGVIAGWGLGRQCSTQVATTTALHTTPAVDQHVESDRAALELRIAGLEADLTRSQSQIAEQRELLRPDALAPKAALDERLALLPAKFPAGNWRPAEFAAEDCWFESLDGLHLHGWYFPHEQPQAAILYIHGNAGNLTHRASAARELHKHLSASVLVFDYRGYGRSEGVPTFAGIVRDAEAARQWLAGRLGIADRDVVLLGESLGGGVAVELAARTGARGLILDSTFASMRDVAMSRHPGWLVNAVVRNAFDSVSEIGEYRGPLLQFHGNRDSVIPFDSAEKLFAAAHEPKRFVALPGKDHNDPNPPEFYWAARQFVSELPAVETPTAP
jgi:fermentation-respiration switch protein FrsA (DUF1100 family)